MRMKSVDGETCTTVADVAVRPAIGCGALMQDRLDQAKRLSRRHMQLQARHLAAKLEDELVCRAEMEIEDAAERGRERKREASLQREKEARLQASKARHEHEVNTLERARHLEWATAVQHLRDQESLDVRRAAAGAIRAVEKEQTVALRRQQQEATEQRRREHEARLECERQRKAAEYNNKIGRIKQMEAARDEILEDLKQFRRDAYGRYDALKDLYHESTVVNNDDLLRRLLENAVPRLSSIPHTPRSSVSNPTFFTKPRAASAEPVSTPRPRLSSHRIEPSSVQRAESARGRVSSPKRTTSARGRVSSPNRPTSARGLALSSRSLSSALSTSTSQRCDASSQKTLANSFVSKVSLDSRSTSAGSFSGSGVVENSTLRTPKKTDYCHSPLSGSSDSPAAPARSKIPLVLRQPFVLRQTEGCSTVLAQPASIVSPRNLAGYSTTTTSSARAPLLTTEKPEITTQGQTPRPVELVMRMNNPAQTVAGTMPTMVASGNSELEQSCTSQHICRKDNYHQLSTLYEKALAVGRHAA